MLFIRWHLRHVGRHWAPLLKNLVHGVVHLRCGGCITAVHVMCLHPPLKLASLFQSSGRSYWDVVSREFSSNTQATGPGRAIRYTWAPLFPTWLGLTAY